MAPKTPMTPGTHLTLHHASSFQDFLEGLALLVGVESIHRVGKQSHIHQLQFPLEGWAGLMIDVKWPANAIYLDLEITIRSAITDVSILSTRDEYIAKMFLTSIVQMYDPTPWGPAVGQSPDPDPPPPSPDPTFTS